MLEEFEGAATIEKVASLCRRRAFVFPSSDIYGGLGSSFDFGHYGVLLNDNVKARMAPLADPGARGRRRARLGDHPQPGGLGRVRSRRRVLGPAGRLPHLQAALPRRPARAERLRQAAVEAPGRDRRLRPHGAARVQPDVRDVRRARPRGRVARVPAARDGAGHLRQLQERHVVDAGEAAVRHRPDRQELPQRDHARELPLPHARVRADGDGVLRAAGRGGGVAPLLDRRAPALAPRPRAARVAPARAPARRGGAVALLERDERHRVPVPDRLARARGGGEPRRLRPAPAHRGVRDDARVDRPRGALRART